VGRDYVNPISTASDGTQAAKRAAQTGTDSRGRRARPGQNALDYSEIRSQPKGVEEGGWVGQRSTARGVGNIPP
jgi:hypothetical protein